MTPFRRVALTVVVVGGIIAAGLGLTKGPGGHSHRKTTKAAVHLVPSPRRPAGPSSAAPSPARFALISGPAPDSYGQPDRDAMATAARWAVAYSSGDPSWRSLSAPSLADQLDGGVTMTDAEVGWTAWAGGTTNTARVLVYLTATFVGATVAVSYDCRLIRGGTGWSVVAVAP
jgi:hypothetical protein